MLRKEIPAPKITTREPRPLRRMRGGSIDEINEKDLEAIPFKPGEVLPEQMPIKKRPVEGLTAEERIELLADRMLAEQVSAERQQEQLKTHGMTDKDLEAEADRWLRLAGDDDLVDNKD